MSGRVVSADINSCQRREFVSPIQHGRKCCKWLKMAVLIIVINRSLSNTVTNRRHGSLFNPLHFQTQQFIPSACSYSIIYQVQKPVLNKSVKSIIVLK